MFCNELKPRSVSKGLSILARVQRSQLEALVKVNSTVGEMSELQMKQEKMLSPWATTNCSMIVFALESVSLLFSFFFQLFCTMPNERYWAQTQI